MPRRHSVTVSPSSSRISRSTPCVDGCCGPMLTTTRSSASRSIPETTESQSCPVTVKTLPDVVSCSRGVGVGVRVGLVVRCRSSVVGPPLVGRRDRRALVLDRDAAERVVLALRVARPVVGHLDPGQRRVPVEDDAEEVVGLALVPVVRRVDRRRPTGCAGRRRGRSPRPGSGGCGSSRAGGRPRAAPRPSSCG